MRHSGHARETYFRKGKGEGERREQADAGTGCRPHTTDVLSPGPPSHTPLLRRRPRSWPWPSSSLLALFLSLLGTHLVFPVPCSPGPGLNGRSLCERGELVRAEECKVVLVVLRENGVPDMRDRAGRRLARSGLGRRCKWLEMRRRGLGVGRHGLCLAEEGRERRRARKGRESANKDGRESEARLERVGFGRSRWASETKVEGRT